MFYSQEWVCSESASQLAFREASKNIEQLVQHRDWIRMDVSWKQLAQRTHVSCLTSACGHADRDTESVEGSQDELWGKDKC